MRLDICTQPSKGMQATHWVLGQSLRTSRNARKALSNAIAVYNDHDRMVVMMKMMLIMMMVMMVRMLMIMVMMMRGPH